MRTRSHRDGTQRHGNPFEDITWTYLSRIMNVSIYKCISYICYWILVIKTYMFCFSAAVMFKYTRESVTCHNQYDLLPLDPQNMHGVYVPTSGHCITVNLSITDNPS